jgi:hypothetical protein
LHYHLYFNSLKRGLLNYFCVVLMRIGSGLFELKLKGENQ